MSRRIQELCLCVPLVVLATSQPAGVASPLLHELISPDPRDDLSLAVSLDGDLPAAMDTPSGVVSAPDPRRKPGADKGTPTDVQGRTFDGPSPTFTPDNDTSRPDALPYDDPFTPSTAPFKRLVAFDAVDASYNLTVRDARLEPVALHDVPQADGSDEQFYGNIVVDLSPGMEVRVPTVGPGARVLHAHLGVETTEIPFRLMHDSADNWFLETSRPRVRARFVVELSIARATFGGDFGDPHASDLVANALPRNVLADANKVAAQIGVARTSPRETVKSLVEYFRSFVDSRDRPTGHANVYLDLALSRKGVCRHRAYAFMVTALGLGIPARMVMNEAHAWVEVYDGTLWKRIDLGGAGRTLSDALASEVPYAAPPDPFDWPPGATRGEDLAQRAQAAGRRASGVSGGSGGSHEGPGSGASGSASDTSPSEGQGAMSPNAGDSRGASYVSIIAADSDPRRGAPLHVRGEVRAEGEPCEHIEVLVSLRDARSHRQRLLGTLATDGTGAFSGALIVPMNVPLGDYEIIARTPGDTRCAAGAGP